MKIGSKVICIRTKDFLKPDIQVGKIYTISEIIPKGSILDDDGKARVDLVRLKEVYIPFSKLKYGTKINLPDGWNVPIQKHCFVEIDHDSYREQFIKERLETYA
jgi:hypothetical protein